MAHAGEAHGYHKTVVENLKRLFGPDFDPTAHIVVDSTTHIERRLAAGYNVLAKLPSRNGIWNDEHLTLFGKKGS
jgi:hypothetical protein